MLSAFLGRGRNRIGGLASLGWEAAISYLIQRWHWSGPGSVFRIQPRSSIHPLFVRRDSSDLHAFTQIFIHRVYGCLDDLTKVSLSSIAEPMSVTPNSFHDTE